MREQTAPYAFESLSRMSKLIDQRRVASSQTHLVLQAYCLTDVDEINPLGIEIWYRMTRSFSILGGIEAIRLVPKKYRTRYPALVISDIWSKSLCLWPLFTKFWWLMIQKIKKLILTEHKFTNKIYCLNCYCLVLLYWNKCKILTWWDSNLALINRILITLLM